MTITRNSKKLSMSGPCVTVESLAERSEVIRFRIFFAGLRHRHMRDQILRRNPEESLREQLGSLGAQEQGRLLFLLEDPLLPIHRPVRRIPKTFLMRDIPTLRLSFWFCFRFGFDFVRGRSPSAPSSIEEVCWNNEQDRQVWRAGP
jgi:hypothetical protein